MPEFDDITELFTAVIVILIISIVIALAWISTYVQEQPILATAVVVFHQDSSPSSSLETTGNQVSERVTTSSSGLNNPMSDPEPIQNSSNSESKDFKSLPVKNDISEKKHTCKDITLQDTDNTQESTSSINTGINAEENTSDLCQGLEATEETEDIKNGSVLRERKNCTKTSNSKNEISEVNVLESDISSGNGSHCEDLTQEYIRIKLKFLDDTQRLVRGQLTDEVGTFKRANFGLELSSNQVVRLIFNGQLLNRDNSTLGQYGLFDNCVVHCHISQQQTSNNNERNINIPNAENDGLDLSEMLSPILVVIIAFLWYLRFSYSHIFNTSSTIVLICLTALLLISQYALTFSVNISFGFREGNGNNNSGSSSNNSNIGSRSHATGDNSRSDLQSEIRNIEEEVPVSSTPSSSQSTSATNSSIENINTPSYKNSNSNKNSSVDNSQATNDICLNTVSDTMVTVNTTTTDNNLHNNNSALILSV